MKISYPWLQTYFDDPLPTPEELADLITFHAFEIEGVETIGCDPVLDIDVLPNRSSDCLSHRGIAKEVSVLLGRSLKEDPLQESPENEADHVLRLTEVHDPDHVVKIETHDLVNRFSTLSLEGVKIGPTPEWLKRRLESLGQKSINNVVDATNYVMFNLGQPLHAFDADKLAGEKGKRGLCVRLANNGEKITTLTGEEHELNDAMLLIADLESDAPLGIAGVKGGKIAEVDERTTNIILEAANFNFVSVRKTSQALKLVTDASVRFQNEPSSGLTPYALNAVGELIIEIAGGTRGSATDWNPNPVATHELSISVSAINHLVGVSLTEADVEKVLARFGWVYSKEGDSFTVKMPWERSDLSITEDLIEEIARVHSYKNVASQILPSLPQAPMVHPNMHYAALVRHALTEAGFSEVFTYALRDHGDIELANSLASDKSHMRRDLKEGIEEALAQNLRNAPLLGREQIRIFELGTVFQKEREALHLCLGVAFTRKFKGVQPADTINDALAHVAKKVGHELSVSAKDAVIELDLGSRIDSWPTPKSYDSSLRHKEESGTKYQPIAAFPFVLRDLAVWVPESTDRDALERIICEAAGELLVRLDLFDEFRKDGRVSYAFHLVFQSPHKTLTDEEVGRVMQNVYTALESHTDCDVR